MPTTFVRKRAFERGVESDVAGAIEDNVDIVGDSLRLVLAVAEIRFGDVAAEDDNFVANESIQRAAVTFAQRIKRWGGDHAVPKTRFRLFLRTSTHRDVDRPILGKRCSSMLSVTFPRKPVLPIRKILRSLKISVGDRFMTVFVIPLCSLCLRGE